jgi:uncharacterized cupredoxin-like copper-binding protein
MGKRMRLLPVLIAACAAFALSACGSSSSESGGTGAATAPSGGQAVAVSAVDFSFNPGTIQIDQPGTYTFTLSNDGSTEHGLEVEGQGVEEELEEVAPSSSGQLTVTFSKTGTYEFYCPVDGHRDRGMEGALTVGEASAGGAGTTEDDHGGGTDTDVSGGYGYG